MSGDGDAMRDLALDECRDKMRRAVAHVGVDFASVRTGRASSALVAGCTSAALPANRCATWPATPGSCPNSEVAATSSSTNALRYMTQLRSPRRHQELT